MHSLLVILAAWAAHVTAGGPGPAASHDFGKVVRGAPVEHVFQLANPLRTPARVIRATLTSPLVVTRLPGPVEPGGAAAIPVRLDTSALDGPFEGEVRLFLDGADEPVSFSIRGTVVGPIEIAPRPVVVVAAVRGEAKEASVELLSHESTPVRVERVEGPPGLTTRVETLEPGRRFRLHVTLRPDAPAGRAQDRIVVHTSSAAAPVLHIAALTNVHERVYTFPDAVDLGAIRAPDLAGDPTLAARLGQTLMVYQVGGTAFEARFRSEVAGVAVTAERSPKGDRWQGAVRLTGKPKPGPISGRIVIETNDASFPRLSVPVTGTILE